MSHTKRLRLTWANALPISIRSIGSTEPKDMGQTIADGPQKKQQASNRKNNTVVIVGKMKMTGAEWCDENGIHPKARYNFYRRFAKGLSPEESIKGLGRI